MIYLTPLINGKSYSQADISVNIMGAPVITLQDINYGDKQKIENLYGTGANVIGRGYGNVEPYASITLLMEEVENIMSVAPKGNIRLIPEFDIVVTYVDLQNVTRKHVLRNCRFTNNDRNVKQNDTSIPVTLELVISDVDWGF